MIKNCRQCSVGFEITQEDLAFYDRLSPMVGNVKLAITPPTLCPGCRWRRRASWRNFRNLYYRKSDLSGKQFVSVFSPEKPYKVYTLEEWWSDEWSPKDFGRDFDFSRPFFEQFAELYNSVPRAGIYVSNSENCNYSNMAFESKNCFDVVSVKKSEFCYECVDCSDCYKVFFRDNQRIAVNHTSYLIAGV